MIGLGVDVAKGTRAASRAYDSGSILFKTDHYASRLDNIGLSTTKAEGAVRQEIDAMRSYLSPDAPFSGRVSVYDSLIEYRAWPLENGNINVGTIFPVR